MSRTEKSKAKGKEKDTERARVNFQRSPFRCGGGKTGNDHVFASLRERNGGVANLNVRTRRGTALVIKNISASTPTFTAPMMVRMMSL